MVDRALMDYVSLPKRMLGRLLDVNVCKGEGGGMSKVFGGSSTESVMWMELDECREDGGCEKCVEGE